MFLGTRDAFTEIVFINNDKPSHELQTNTFIICLTAAHNISNTFQTKPTSEKLFSTQTIFTFKIHFAESFIKKQPPPSRSSLLRSCTYDGILEKIQREKAFGFGRLSNSFIIEYRLCWDAENHINLGTCEIFCFYFDNFCSYDGWNNLVLVSITSVPCSPTNEQHCKMWNVKRSIQQIELMTFLTN